MIITQIVDVENAGMNSYMKTTDRLSKNKTSIASICYIYFECRDLTGIQFVLLVNETVCMSVSFVIWPLHVSTYLH